MSRWAWIGRRVTAPVKGARSRAGARALGYHHADDAAGDDPDGEQRQHLGAGEAALTPVRQAHRAQPDRELGALGPGRGEQQQDGEEGQHGGEQDAHEEGAGDQAGQGPVGDVAPRTR